MEQALVIATICVIIAGVLYDALRSKPTQDEFAADAERNKRLVVARKHARYAADRECQTHLAKNDVTIGYKLPWGNERDEYAQYEWRVKRQGEIFEALKDRRDLFTVKDGVLGIHA